MPEQPQLAPLDAEEQWLYYQLLSPSLRLSPATVWSYLILLMVSFFRSLPTALAIGEGCNIN